MARRTVPGKGKARTMNLRCTPELRKRIAHACAQSGRSISAEVAHCVEQTLDWSDIDRTLDHILDSQFAIREHLKRLTEVLLDGPTALSTDARRMLRELMETEVQHNG